MLQPVPMFPNYHFLLYSDSGVFFFNSHVKVAFILSTHLKHVYCQRVEPIFSIQNALVWYGGSARVHLYSIKLTEVEN